MSVRHAELFKTLPPKLIRFFERFPPQLYGKNAAAPNTTHLNSNADYEKPPSTSSTPAAGLISPFQRNLHPVTGRWHEPMHSLRRQADLVKLAKEHGVEDLLPFTTKGTKEKLAYRIEKGIRVKGTGVGQKVKGHWHERTMRARLDKRRQAMVNMPKMIYEWKQLGHGRGWKKFPK